MARVENKICFSSFVEVFSIEDLLSILSGLHSLIQIFDYNYNYNNKTVWAIE